MPSKLRELKFYDNYFSVVIFSIKSMIVNSSHALRLSVCRRRYGPPAPPPLLQAPSTVPAPPPHRLRGTRRAFPFPNRSRPTPPAGPTRRPKPSLALSQPARRLHLRAAAHLHRPAAAGIYSHIGSADLCSHALLLRCTWVSTPCRQPATPFRYSSLCSPSAYST